MKDKIREEIEKGNIKVSRQLAKLNKEVGELTQEECEKICRICKIKVEEKSSADEAYDALRKAVDEYEYRLHLRAELGEAEVGDDLFALHALPHNKDVEHTERKQIEEMIKDSLAKIKECSTQDALDEAIFRRDNKLAEIARKFLP